MPFQKNNEFKYLPDGNEPMDKHPVCLNVRMGVREKLKSVPNWRERIRDFIDELITESGQNP